MDGILLYSRKIFAQRIDAIVSTQELLIIPVILTLYNMKSEKVEWT